MRLRARWGGVLPVAIILILPLVPAVLKAGYRMASVGHTVPVREAQAAETNNAGSAISLADLRFELLASLDLLVRAQRTVQVDSGSFSRAIGRVPDVLGPIAQYYRVEIERANREGLLIAASGASSGEQPIADGMPDIGRDAAAIDERFNVRMNFPMPNPPAGYLRALAQSVLKRIVVFSANQIPERARLDEWEGVFRGHFTYEFRSISNGGRVPVAVPVTEYARAITGRTELVLEPNGESLLGWMKTHRDHMFADYAARARLRQVYLAQKMIQRETGSFARNIGELSSAGPSILSLEAPSSSLKLEVLEADPTFGYQAEIAIYSGDEQVRNMWSINGYGQTVQINTVEQLFGKLEKAKRNLEPTRKVGSESGARELEIEVAR